MDWNPETPRARRGAIWWTSTAQGERTRLLPPWVALAFGAAVALALALLFPFQGLQRTLERADAPLDALLIAYVEAWLVARPQNAALRLSLARQLMRAGDWQRAQAHLARVLAEGDAGEQRTARRLLFDADWERLQRLEAGDEAAATLREALRQQLHEALQTEPDPVAGLQLAQRALALGETALAVAYWERLLAASPALPAALWESAGLQALAVGRHVLAARLLLAARGAERRLAERRRLFLAAMRAAQAGNALAEALDLAERHLGELVADTETLEFLTRLALAANRPDLAQRYAVLLLRLSLAPFAPTRAPGAWPALALAAASPVRTAEAPAATPRERAARLPYDERLYTLAFDVFLANGNLQDALAVARSAVRQRPDDLRWRRRAAQVADWAGQPRLALEQWEAIARRTGRADDWDEVRRRAEPLGESALRLQALEALLRLRASDRNVARQWLQAVEDAGAPERALQWLRGALQETGADAWREERLQSLARLAEQLGERALERAALRTLQRDFGVTVERALALAALAEAQRDPDGAWEALAAALPLAERDVAGQRDFWRARAGLALARGDAARAIEAWERLVGAGAADSDVYAALTDALEGRNLERAARIAEHWWRKSGEPRAGVRALGLLLRAGEAAAVRAWLGALTPAQRALLEGEAEFLALRAQWSMAEGERRAAARDAVAAYARDPSAAREAFALWLLIAADEAGELRLRLLAAGERALADVALAQPVAAGWLHLQQPARALPYLARLARAGTDPLWRLEYALALERLGATDLATDERLRVWRTRDALLDGAAGPQRAARLLPLAAQFASGDAALAWLRAVASRARADATAQDAVLAYWLARDAAEVASAWLLARRAGEAPAWARLAVATAEDDGARLGALLDQATVQRQSKLALAEAASRTGDFAAAQTFAFEALDEAPALDEAHRRLRELTLGATASTAPQRVEAEVATLRQAPLLYETHGAAAVLRLGTHARLLARWEAGSGESLDGSALAVVPAMQRFELGLDWALSRNTELQLRAIGRDDGGDTGLALRWQGLLAPRLSAAALIGRALPVQDNAYLRLAAQSQRVALEALARLDSRDTLFALLQEDRFESLRGEPVGAGRLLRVGAQHALRSEYPDAVARLSFSDARYRAAAGVAGGLLALLPSAAQPGASNATFLPASSQRLALELAVGETVRGAWSARWRPYAALALSRESRLGTNDYALRLGAAGSVLGGDALELEFGTGSALAGQRTRYTDGMLRYRFAF
jgi:hypothetical protein